MFLELSIRCHFTANKKILLFIGQTFNGLAQTHTTRIHSHNIENFSHLIGDDVVSRLGVINRTATRTAGIHKK